eukprot:COSAG01_NODE_2483_length_7600_cov_4.742034_7_plen_71_part_00
MGHVLRLNNCSHGLIARTHMYGGQAPGLVNVDHLICEHNYMESTWEGASFYFKCHTLRPAHTVTVAGARD